MAQAARDLIGRGWEALADADWDAARACFEQAVEYEASAEALDGLGRTLHFQREYPRAIELGERAFAAYRAEGKPVEAADQARLLAMLHGGVNCNMAVASGWMGRAASLLETTDECAGHGWLAVDRAPFTEDLAERERLAAAALAIARRFGDVDLEYDALALLGESYVAAGRVAEGIRLIDEAMTAVSAGEVVGIVPVGDICCRLLSACEMTRDVARAEQWMSVAGPFAVWSDFVSPVCRTHYGGILVAVGRWPEAEVELLGAIETFERGYRLLRGGPLLKLAELRVRQGRFEEARRLLEGNESDPVARLALAAIALGRGELPLAEDLLGLCLEGGDGPAPALDLLVQVRLARKDVAGATDALARLEELAADSEDRLPQAFGDLAAGRVRAATGDEESVARLQAALRKFAALDLPLEAARAQLELAGALAERAAEGAAAEARLALRTFERLGAGADADAAGALLRRLGSTGRAWPKRYGTLTKRETEVLALLAEGCSNAQIAERLVISKRTAEHHVAHILSKLDLHGRAEAAAFAVRELPKER
jgi:DNA-binding NarL/FixJ family response regulator/tetratricopeptide (TPR) repeat protein